MIVSPCVEGYSELVHAAAAALCDNIASEDLAGAYTRFHFSST